MRSHSLSAAAAAVGLSIGARPLQWHRTSPAVAANACDLITCMQRGSIRTPKARNVCNRVKAIGSDSRVYARTHTYTRAHAGSLGNIDITCLGVYIADVSRNK